MATFVSDQASCFGGNRYPMRWVFLSTSALGAPLASLLPSSLTQVRLHICEDTSLFAFNSSGQLEVAGRSLKQACMEGRAWPGEDSLWSASSWAQGLSLFEIQLRVLIALCTSQAAACHEENMRIPQRSRADVITRAQTHFMCTCTHTYTHIQVITAHR